MRVARKKRFSPFVGVEVCPRLNTAFVLAAFVIAIDWVVTLVENRLLVWRPVAAETRT